MSTVFAPNMGAAMAGTADVSEAIAAQREEWKTRRVEVTAAEKRYSAELKACHSDPSRDRRELAKLAKAAERSDSIDADLLVLTAYQTNLESFTRALTNRDTARIPLELLTAARDEVVRLQNARRKNTLVAGALKSEVSVLAGKNPHLALPATDELDAIEQAATADYKIKLAEADLSDVLVTLFAAIVSDQT